MKRTLILLRHAEAESLWHAASDFDRVLTEHGLKEAEGAARSIKQYWRQDGSIYHSPAARTTRTAKVVAENIGADRLIPIPSFYEAEASDLVNFIRGLPAGEHCVLIVGHNPIISWFASELSSRIIMLDTAGFIVLGAEGDSWSAPEWHEVLLTN